MNIFLESIQYKLCFMLLAKKKKMALLFHHYISQRATYKKIESPESSAELLKYYPNTFHSFP